MQIDVQEFLDRTNINIDNVLAIGDAASGLHVGASNIIGNLHRIGDACPNLKGITCIADKMPLFRFRALFELPNRDLGNSVCTRLAT